MGRFIFSVLNINIILFQITFLLSKLMSAVCLLSFWNWSVMLLSYLKIIKQRFCKWWWFCTKVMFRELQLYQTVEWRTVSAQNLFCCIPLQFFYSVSTNKAMFIYCSTIVFFNQFFLFWSKHSRAMMAVKPQLFERLTFNTVHVFKCLSAQQRTWECQFEGERKIISYASWVF